MLIVFEKCDPKWILGDPGEATQGRIFTGKIIAKITRKKSPVHLFRHTEPVPEHLNSLFLIGQNILKYFWNWFGWFGKAYGGVFNTYSGLARACFVRLTGFPRMSLRDHI